MKTNMLKASAALMAAMFVGVMGTQAQEVVTVEESVTTYEVVPCQNHYYSTSGDNWFIQLGAGVNSPFVENMLPDGTQKHHMTVGYNFAFGKWMSPYLGWRLSFLGGPLHWDNDKYSKAKYVSGNFDLMWDMFNSFKVNPNRVFSIVPFVGLGGTFAWDFKGNPGNIVNDHGAIKHNQWTLPVSAGLQLRFRLCKYVDFFAEGRAQFYGDNFNNYAWGRPVDVNITAMGGFTFNLGGSGFKSYNPCDNLAYIAALNDQVNSLRADLATTAAALAVAESQLPCPEVSNTTTVVENTPVMATVRFKINSDVISPEEQVNVYNVAQWMKANPEANVAIVGYADRDTGTSAYNMELSQRRANNVARMLVNKYGINPDRLTTAAEGSDVQPYNVNDWNRIVIFTAD